MNEHGLKNPQSFSEKKRKKISKGSPPKIAKFLVRKNSLLKEEIDRKREEKERHQRPATADAAGSYSKRKSQPNTPMNFEAASAQASQFENQSVSFVSPKTASLKAIFQSVSQNPSRKHSSVIFDALGLNKLEEHQKIVEPSQVLMADALHKRHRTLSRFNFQIFEGLSDNPSPIPSIPNTTKNLKEMKETKESKETSGNIHMMKKRRTTPISPMANIAFFMSHKNIMPRSVQGNRSVKLGTESIIL